MKTLNNERGMILLTVMILLVIGTIVGIVAINSSRVEVEIYGNERRAAMAFAGAEAGVDLAVPIIENTLAEGTLTPSSFTVGGSAATIDSSLQNEIFTIASSVNAFDTDILIGDLGGVEVEVDIDRLHSKTQAGGALEFAMGYEGVGMGAAGGGISLFYRVGAAGTK